MFTYIQAATSLRNRAYEYGKFTVAYPLRKSV